jgi:hypothetical protein
VTASDVVPGGDVGEDGGDDMALMGINYLKDTLIEVQN